MSLLWFYSMSMSTCPSQNGDSIFGQNYEFHLTLESKGGGILEKMRKRFLTH